jgi:hypothetical protein
VDAHLQHITAMNVSMTVLLPAKIMKTWLAAMLLATCVLTGCQSPQALPPVQGIASTRNNCYSLLHQLLDEQKDVSLLHFIKSEHPDVKILIKKIATTSATGATLLEQFAKDDPTINLNDIRLCAFRYVHQRADILYFVRFISGSAGNHLDPFNRAIWHQKAVLVFEILAFLHSAADFLGEESGIVRMNPLPGQFQ